MNTHLKKKPHFLYPKALSGIFFILLFSAYLYAFANPPGSPYNPGTTLDPTCAPGDTNCFVQIIPSQWTTTGSDIYYNTGKVGIGTSTPNNTLQVVDLIDFNNTDLNTKLGYQSGKNIVTGAQQNTFVGYQAGLSSAGSSTNAADGNSAFGYQSLFSNTTGNLNTANGFQSLYSNTTGFINTGMGAYTLYLNTTGQKNTAVGIQSLFNSTTGSNNTALGTYALVASTSGDNNVAAGYRALYSNTTGRENTAVGQDALYNVTTGVNNTAVGNTTGYGITTGSYNTIIGALVTGLSSSLSNTIIIADGQGNKRIYVDNSGNTGLGTATPSSKLDITTNSLGTTQTTTSGLALVNTTSAAAGAQQISPAIRWSGQGWKTNATAASQPVDFQAYVLPSQGASNPAGVWKLQSSVNGGAYTDRLTVTESGSVNIPTVGQSLSVQILQVGDYINFNSATRPIYLQSSSGNPGQVLTSNGNAAPSWTTPSVFSLTSGSGTTASGSAVNLGGILSSNADIEGTSNGVDFMVRSEDAGLKIIHTSGLTQVGDVANGNNLFVVDNPNGVAYYDNTAHTGNFGINTSTPSVALDVLGKGLFTSDNSPNDNFRIYNSTDETDALLVNNADKLVIIDTGGAGYKFGIGTNAPSATFHLIGSFFSSGTVQMNNYGAGTATFDAAGNITSVSDERLKDIQGSYTSGLNELMNINPILYKWNTVSKLETEHVYAGFSAQNIQANIPYGTGQNKDGYLTLQERAITATLVNAVKELNIKIQDLSSLDTTNTNSLGSLIKQFLGDIGNSIDVVFFGEVHTKKLCLEDVCVTKDQLQQMLNNSTANSGGGSGGDTPPPPPTGGSTDVCPNIDGDQTIVPDGMHLDDTNNCVANDTPPPAEIPPPADGVTQ